MRFASASSVTLQSAARMKAKARTMGVTAMATPYPTPVPIPAPTGNPLFPTRDSIGVGSSASISNGITAEVVDTNGNPVVEPSAPTTYSTRPDILTLLCCQPVNTQAIPDGWSAGFSQNAPMGPQQIQMAFQFPDSTGVVTINAYDAFTISCQPGFWLSVDVTSGIAQQATGNGDVYLTNCGNGNAQLNFTNQFMLAAPQQPDFFGDLLPAFNNLLNAVPFQPLGSQIDGAQVAQNLVGTIIQAPDVHNVQNKYMVYSVSTDSSGNVNGFGVLHLAANAGGVFAF